MIYIIRTHKNGRMLNLLRLNPNFARSRPATEKFIDREVEESPLTGKVLSAVELDVLYLCPSINLAIL